MLSHQCLSKHASRTCSYYIASYYRGSYYRGSYYRGSYCRGSYYGGSTCGLQRLYIQAAYLRDELPRLHLKILGYGVDVVALTLKQEQVRDIFEHCSSPSGVSVCALVPVSKYVCTSTASLYQ
jgi:hypothetical protein